MFIICDSNGMVKDIATEQANLSRGYGFENYVLYENVVVNDIHIGDTFDGSTVTHNQTLGTAASQLQSYESIIQHKIRELAIAAAIADEELPSNYTDSY